MATALQLSAWQDLDFLLDKIVEDLQLTPSQFQKAVETYGAVAKWLQAPGSRLALMMPTIYPQGSMALQTTLRPRGRVEHDLDLVSEVRTTMLSAMELYDTLYDRLFENGQYRPILVKLKRCVRLDYAGNFHLDVIPARPDDKRPRPCILVPDRALVALTPSNPRGFVAWFKARSEGRVLLREAEPLPPQDSPLQKSPLTIAVQLIKRRRDIMFDGAETAPRSVLLTTLAGLCYKGEQHAALATFEILQRIQGAIDNAAPDYLDVRNPTNEAENFSEVFKKDKKCYEAFKRLIATFRGELEELLGVRGGILALHGQLSTMFGEGPVTRAMESFAERAGQLRSRELRFGSAGGLAIIGNTHETPHTVPRNNFYGE